VSVTSLSSVECPPAKYDCFSVELKQQYSVLFHRHNTSHALLVCCKKRVVHSFGCNSFLCQYPYLQVQLCRSSASAHLVQLVQR
jgi:hypothetical protein